jgi:hypothetical protein
MNINNIYFYLLLGVFLYFLFTHVLENYLVEHENFDPSLVPVSSIVTLAKVAQKLVNGNGTLTNPGNLQIGKDAEATGNLTVTGKTTFGNTTMGANTVNVTGTLGVVGNTAMVGSLSVNGPLTVASNQNFNVTGNTTMGGTLGVTGNTILSNTTVGGTLNTNGNSITNGNLNVAAGSGNNGINITSGNPYISFNKTGSNGQPQLYSDGTVLHAYNAPFQVDQNLIVGGRLTIPHSVWHQSSDGKNRLHYGSNSHTYFGTNDGYIWRSSADRDLMSLNGAGELTVNGNLNVTGSIRVGNFNIGREANGITIRRIGGGDNRVYIPDGVYKDL